MRRRVLALLYAAALTLPALAHAAPSQADKLKATMNELESQRDKAQAIAKQRNQVARELGDLRKNSKKLVKNIREQQKAADKNRTEIKRLKREKQAQTALLKEREAQLHRLLSGMIRMQRVPSHYVALQGEDMQQMLKTASALDITFAGTREAFAQVQRDYARIDALQAQLLARQALLEGRLVQVKQQQNELTGLITKRRKLQQNLQRDQARITQKVRQLSDKSGDLQELIARLEAETSLFERITPASKPPAPRKPSIALSKRKGKLPYPAAGKLLHRFGQKRKDSAERYQGIELRTAAKAPVTTPHSGKVVFSGSFMDYGPMVIIEHDKAYHSVIAGLDVVAVQPAQNVGSGELIGTMGASATSRLLYYELRKHSKAIDPAPWMGNVTLATRN